MIYICKTSKNSNIHARVEYHEDSISIMGVVFTEAQLFDGKPHYITYDAKNITFELDGMGDVFAQTVSYSIFEDNFLLMWKAPISNDSDALILAEAFDDDLYNILNPFIVIKHDETGAVYSITDKSNFSLMQGSYTLLGVKLVNDLCKIKQSELVVSIHNVTNNTNALDNETGNINFSISGLYEINIGQKNQTAPEYIKQFDFNVHNNFFTLMSVR